MKIKWCVTGLFALAVCWGLARAQAPARKDHATILRHAATAKLSAARKTSFKNHQLTPAVAPKHHRGPAKQHLIGKLEVPGKMKDLAKGTHHLLLHRDGKRWAVSAAHEGGTKVARASRVQVSNVRTGKKGVPLPKSAMKQGSLIVALVFVIGTVEGTDPDPDDDHCMTATPLFVIISFQFS